MRVPCETYKSVILHGSNSSVRIDEALLDTGASSNLIGEFLPNGKSLMEIGWLEALPEQGEFEIVGGGLIKGDLVIFPKLEIDQRIIRDVQFAVIQGWTEVIIGACTMQDFDLKIDTGIGRAYL